MGVGLAPISLTPGVPVPVSLVNLGNIQSLKVTNNSPFDLTVSGFGVQGTDIIGAKSEVRLYSSIKNVGVLNIFPVNNTGSLGSGTVNIVVYDMAEQLPPGYWPQPVASISGQSLTSPDPTFVATVGYEATVGFDQVLNVSNPANSGNVYVFDSIRGYTNAANDDTRLETIITPGGDLSYTTPIAINPISDNSSVSTAHASSSDNNNSTPQNSKVLEIYQATQRVTAELANVPITVYPNHNLSVVANSLTQTSKVMALTMKWLENIIALGSGPSGGGPAVPTLTGIFSPLDFQAIGNGVADDTVPVKNCLAAVQSLGYGIILLNGLFKVSSSVTQTQGKIGWVGLGEGTGLTIANGSNCYAIVLSAGPGITGAMFKDFSIFCNGANQTAGGGINANGGYRNIYDNLYIDTPYDAGIWWQFGPGGGFGYQNSAHNVRFFGTSSVAGNGRGLFIDNNDENDVDDCFFQQLQGTSGSDNFAIRDDNGLTSYRGCKFVGNNTKMGGIKCYATVQSGIRVNGCVFDGVGAGNIVLPSGGGGGSSIIGNRFMNIGFGATVANSVDGIYVAATDVMIEGNWFSPDGGGHCLANVELDGTNGQDYGTVIGNTFAAVNGGSLQIKTDGAPAHNTVINNTLH